MVKSRRIKLESITTELPNGYGYCRKCQKVRTLNYFFSALDSNIDSNNNLSICKDCCDTMYRGFLESENGVIEKAILRMCKVLNMKFDQAAVDAAKRQIESRESDPLKIIGYYKAKLIVTNRSYINEGANVLNLEYQDSPIINLNTENQNDNNNIGLSEDIKDLSLFWGTNFTRDELEILESKYSEWAQSHSIDTQSERVLLKYICLKEYEIDKAVIAGSNTSSLMKEFQELLKTSALSPSTATLASGGKAQETWGNFIKMIEETTPAEYYKDDNLFKDYDNINWIWQNFVVRSIKNFLTGSRDFNLTDIDTDYEEEEENADVEETPPLEYKTEE